MSDELHLTLTAPWSKRVIIGWQIMRRVLGAWRSQASVALFFAVGLICGLTVGWLKGFTIGITLQPVAFSVFGCLVTMIAANNWSNRVLKSAKARQSNDAAVFSDRGMSWTTAVAWQDVTSVFRSGDMTVLLFSEVECLAVQDSDLPPELSPEQFQVKIAQWRGEVTK